LAQQDDDKFSWDDHFFGAVTVGERGQVVIPAGCPTTTQLLEARGYRTFSVQLDEFLKSGGAAQCLTLSLD
jgi:N-dimethylarginine dimethylaminohydrolase